MTRFCLVRHGQTDWNLEGRYQGQSDVPLNGQGRAQAQSAAGLLQGQAFAAIYSSDLKRASETAEIIGTALRLPVRLAPHLREIHQGEWEGQHVDAIKAHYASLWQARAIDPASVRPPGGETVAEVATRVCAALDEIANRHPDASILIVSHGLALATVICKVQGLSCGQAYHFIPENVQPVCVEWV
jgi:alpha-ribazole phosphatase